ncbi:MAG TPA: PEP-CTERM sorting domain-containing protein [Candidatus Angelobacter sp.]|nr:PEP-CTERM sorting domain-containing protein [Candidatus Angelobacter sp.]
MKAKISMLVSFIVVLTASAQGTVNFANTATSLLIEGLGGPPVPVGQFTVELLYWASDPGATTWSSSIAGLTSIKTSANFVSPGRFIGGVATTPATTAGGATAWFAVVAWQTSFGSYDAAVTGGGFYGYTGAFQNATGNPNAVPPGPAAALNVFTGNNNILLVPEPSILWLSAVGAAGMLSFRGRKTTINKG